MFEERNACSCDTKSLNPVKEPSRATTCETAANLLACLRHVEEMMDRLDRTLFNADRNCMEKPMEPDCLDSNINMAFDSAKSIARQLESILGRL